MGSTPSSVTTTTLTRVSFPVERAFKAVDRDGYQKWIVTARAADLPVNLPLDANARRPNIIKNRAACPEMRETLLTQPELFIYLNGGVICTAASVDAKQVGRDHVVDVMFDSEAEQGIVNGGHTYAQLCHLLQADTQYAEGLDLKSVLAKDLRASPNPLLQQLFEDDVELKARVRAAQERTLVQIEFVAPVESAEILTQIARARNISQSVEATAFANLAGRFEPMKEVLGEFDADLAARVVWKTNQEVPEGSKAISVKDLVYLLALYHAPRYRTPAHVYSRPGIIVREFAEAENGALEYYDALTRLLPQLIHLHDHIYATIPEVQPTPGGAEPWLWASGKRVSDRQPKSRTVPTTPFLARPTQSRVAREFVWPIFAAFRQLIMVDGLSARFRVDPIELFDTLRRELVNQVVTLYQQPEFATPSQFGRSTEIWIRTEATVATELAVQARLQQRT